MGINRLALILFGITVVFFVAVGLGYLYVSTGGVPGFLFKRDFTSPGGGTDIESALRRAATKCKVTGYETYEEAGAYLDKIIVSTGALDYMKSAARPEVVIQAVSIGNRCWGLWIGVPSGEKGMFIYENAGGKILKQANVSNLAQ